MKNLNSFLLFLLLFCFACNSPAPSNDQTGGKVEEQSPTSEQDGAKKETTKVAPEAMIALDKINIAGLTQLDTYSDEGEGDCSYEGAKYQLGNDILVVDKSNCYDYGGSTTYYLLNAEGKIQQIHKRSQNNYVDSDANGNAKFMADISEFIYDFRQDPPTLMTLSDEVERPTGTPKVNRISLDASKPWVIVSRDKPFTVLGEATSITELEVYEASRQRMIDSLVQLNGVPDEIPIQFGENFGMGTRGEFRSMCSEAIDMAKKVLQEKAKDPFSLTKKQLVEAKPEGDEASALYWKGKYDAMW